MKRALVLALLPVLGLFAEKSDRRDMSDPTVWPTYQPLVIVGEGWSQQFVIQNVGDYKKINVRGSLKFFDQSGRPWPIEIVGRGRVSSIPLDIPVYGSVTFETAVFTFPQQLGWAMIEVPNELAERNYIHAHTIFRKQSPGRADLMTSAPMTDNFSDQGVIYFDNTDGKYAGIAILSSASSEDTFTLTFYGEDGQPFHRATKRLRAGEMWWFSLAAEFPATANRRGQIVVAGGFGDAQCFSLQFTPNGAFTAISTSVDF